MWSSSFMLSALLFVVSISLLMMKVSVSFSWSVFRTVEWIDTMIMIDEVTLIFVGMVGLVSFSVFIYFNKYMQGSVFKKKFSLGMLFFLISMVLLSISGDALWMMIGWDGLGLSSFYLIVFYQNWKSLNSSMVTFLSNRLGDSLIIISLCVFLGIGGLKYFEQMSSVVTAVFLLGGMTKSAQFPFSSWLPLAMAAPTPVSSLVHSSTLVTAGVFMFVRFTRFFSEETKQIMFFISFLTIVLACSSSVGEYDLKKIIALSTLSHVGLMVMFLSMGMVVSACVHLVIHSLFKSLLFMVAGDLIHSGGNNQDIRGLSVLTVDFPVGVSLLTSVLSMAGLPFLAGFFSKEELLLSLSFLPSFVGSITFLLSVLMTASYGTRLLLSVFSHYPSSMSLDNSSNSWAVFAVMSLFSTFGGLFVYIFSKEKGVFVSYVSSLFKESVLLPLFVGVVVGYFFLKTQGIKMWVRWVHWMWSLETSFKVFQSMFFGNSFFLMFKIDKGGTDKTLITKISMLSFVAESVLGLLVLSPMMILGTVSLVILFFWSSLINL
nr:NADH dehydrogenase subunit 5 [Strongylocotes lipogonus]